MLLVSACAGQRAYSAPVAWRDEASRRLRSGLDCLTTRRFDGREVVRHFECDRLAEGQWRCAPGVDFLVVDLAARSVLVGPGEPTAMARAVLQIAEALGRHETTFNGRDLNAMMRGRCHVREIGPAAFEGGIDYLMSCGERGVVVTRDCGTRPCRVFPSELRDGGIAPAAPTVAAAR